MFLTLDIHQDMKKELQDVKLFKEHAPHTRFNILTSEQLFPLSQHSGASFPLAIIAPSSTLPAWQVWRCRNNEEGGWCECSTWPIWALFLIFIAQIEPKFIVPTWWMSVNSNFSPLQTFIKEIYAHRLEHIISSCRFFTGIHWHFWKWLIVTKQTYSSYKTH